MASSIREPLTVCVASGKGGTGKTLVATSLAVALAETQRVQFVDCDVEEPNAHIFLKPGFDCRQPVYVSTPVIDESRCDFCRTCADVCAYHAIAIILNTALVFPELCHGCGACGHFCPRGAISETNREIGVIEVGRSGQIEFVQGRLGIGEPRATSVIRAARAAARGAGMTIIDAAPGTSCAVVEAVKGTDYCLLVTEETPFGLSDLKLAVEMVRGLGVPCGVVVNRADRGYGPLEEFCAQHELPVLLRIPLEQDIARQYARGVTLAAHDDNWRKAFRRVAAEIQGRLVAGVAERGG